ncbi:MAG: TlpA family protein disulfide reductase, partial [Muribaculaceae bacterium]|nr:TlpA family protein disulfide reductase [Muribaculaceae bacterium]
GAEVAFVGVACRDSKENWLKALDQYKLPWINLWASDDNLKKISADYSLRGFPTKLIIDPAGKVRNTTIGEDPAFYDTLNSLISGK